MSASNANDHEQAAPTAKDPWTATLCWARGQNHGAVSVFPNRVPVYAVVGRLVGGDSFSEVAADFDVPQEALHVLWQLRLDLLEAEPFVSRTELTSEMEAMVGELERRESES